MMWCFSYSIFVLKPFGVLSLHVLKLFTRYCSSVLGCESNVDRLRGLIVCERCTHTPRLKLRTTRGSLRLPTGAQTPTLKTRLKKSHRVLNMRLFATKKRLLVQLGYKRLLIISLEGNGGKRGGEQPSDNVYVGKSSGSKTTAATVSIFATIRVVTSLAAVGGRAGLEVALTALPDGEAWKQPRTGLSLVAAEGGAPPPRAVAPSARGVAPAAGTVPLATCDAAPPAGNELLPYVSPAGEHHQLGLEHHQLGLEHHQLGLEHHQLGMQHHQLGMEHHQLGMERHHLGLEHHQLRLEQLGLERRRLGQRQHRQVVWQEHQLQRQHHRPKGEIPTRCQLEATVKLRPLGWMKRRCHNPRVSTMLIRESEGCHLYHPKSRLLLACLGKREKLTAKKIFEHEIELGVDELVGKGEGKAEINALFIAYRRLCSGCARTEGCASLIHDVARIGWFTDLSSSSLETQPIGKWTAGRHLGYLPREVTPMPIWMYGFTRLMIHHAEGRHGSSPIRFLLEGSVIGMLKTTYISLFTSRINRVYIDPLLACFVELFVSYTAKKNSMQLTCSMLQPSFHSNSTFCTVTVHQSLVESLLEHGWSNNRSFLGLSACQLQAVEQVLFAVKINQIKNPLIIPYAIQEEEGIVQVEVPPTQPSYHLIPFILQFHILFFPLQVIHSLKLLFLFLRLLLFDSYNNIHCNKNVLNCLPLTCRKSNKAFVTVPKHLHMQTGGVWMTAWLEHAALTSGLSQRQMALVGQDITLTSQADESAFKILTDAFRLQVKPTTLHDASRYSTRGNSRLGSAHGGEMSPGDSSAAVVVERPSSRGSGGLTQRPTVQSHHTSNHSGIYSSSQLLQTSFTLDIVSRLLLHSTLYITQPFRPPYNLKTTPL
ncbi:putative signal peptide protein [Puccinia sorghi]|uniref:Putative signal peptide protein n=1 Tax=Puccinia sorghi TaxID=27349 RepID=A0A0L6UWS4_9BASI|nr:putative signal peptide protein [Puccinia sorghi]